MLSNRDWRLRRPAFSSPDRAWGCPPVHNDGVFGRRRGAKAQPPSALPTSEPEGASPSPPLDEADDGAPGWDAITAAAAALHGAAEEVHRAPVPGPAFGGGVQGISAYRAPDHWHFVTYGLSELYDKIGDDPTTSGWGYELTLRTPADDASVVPNSVAESERTMYCQ